MKNVIIVKLNNVIFVLIRIILLIVIFAVVQKGNGTKNRENFYNLKNLSSYEKNLTLFNLGYVTEVNLEQLNCQCGFLTSFICAACGNVSCSQECHFDYYTNKNICSFNENFNQESGIQSLPSIVSKNIQIIQKNDLPLGKILNRTSLFFIMAYNHQQKNWIYLQRGFRQYGNPIEITMNQYKVQSEKNIDFYKLQKRLCTCNCIVCADKYDHSVLNCSQICNSENSQKKLLLRQLQDFNQLDEVCQCNCKICSSGKINILHQLRDCFLHCPDNKIYKNLQNE